MTINTGRWTVGGEDDVVVFLIGLRLNRPWKVTRWWPVLTAMPRMLRWLDAHPQEGLLHYEMALKSPISPMVIQYWRSFADLERFARDSQAPHLPAWSAFNRALGGSGDVGVWHETYRVGRGQREAIYADMPARGLARALGPEPIGSTAATAARRIGDRPDDAPPLRASY